MVGRAGLRHRLERSPGSLQRSIGALTFALFTAIMVLPGACAESPAVLGIDLARLDDDGLTGPPDGRRALDYEFCIPGAARYREEVARIDPSARFFPGSRGRIGCRSHEVLVLGNTHQPGFSAILLSLARLPYVTRIEEAFFE